MEFKGPEEQWDTHPKKKIWGPVLDEARRRGWKLTRYSDHSWGGIFCPADECDVDPILSTADGAEGFADGAMKTVKKCPHSADDRTRAAADATDHLDAAERFADAADEFIERDEQDAEAARLVELADASTTGAEELTRQFDVASQQSVSANWTGKAFLEGTRLEAANEAAEVVEGVLEEVSAAEASMSTAALTSESHPDLVDRTSRMRTRVDKQRAVVGLLPADRKP